MKERFSLAKKKNKAYLQFAICAAVAGMCSTGASAQPWQVAATNPFSNVDVGSDAQIALVDLDNDGDLDLASGSKCNNFYYYKNTGTKTNPVYANQTGSNNPFNGLCRGNSSVDFIDWDKDGDLDMVSGDADGRLYYYKNIGSATSPNFCAAPTPNVFSSLGDLGSCSNAEFVDWDNDGSLDMFVVLGNGTIKYFRNNGNNTGFTQKTGTDNPFNGGYDGCNGSIAFTDVDGDGDLDAVIGNQSGNGSGKNYLVYYERTGTNTVVKRNTSTNNPYYNIKPGNCSGDADPDFADVDGDGDMDLVIGAGNGKVYLYKNEASKPNTSDITATTPFQTPKTIDVVTGTTAGGTGTTNAVNPKSVAVATPPANGTVTVNPVTGLITYTPNNGFSGTDVFTYTVSNKAGTKSTPKTITITVGQPVRLSLKAFLGGAFNGTRNKDVTTAWVNVLKVKALSQPYNTAAFGNYTGTESVPASIFTVTAADNDVVDWVLLELKKADGTLVSRCAALILENGNIVNLDKSASVSLKAAPGNYHLTIRHRNHLGLSTEPIAFVAGNNNFDFTAATDATLFGTSAAFKTQNGKTLLIGGNANSNINVRYNGIANDRDAILTYVGGSEIGLANNVYAAQDLNLDGTVRYNGLNNDRDFLLAILQGNEIGFIQEQIK